DHVLATDPETGVTGSRPVTTLITGDGTKNLVKLTIDIDGTRGAATDVITATDEHPFWIPALREWLPAGQLQPGMWLQTSAGTHVQLTAVQKWTTTQRVHNLTVDELHTYYVLAGTTPVLVHNCGGIKYVTYTKTNPVTGKVYTGRTRGYGDPADIIAARDAGHHMNDQGFGPAVLDKWVEGTLPVAQRHSDTAYRAIRGREQNLIDFFGGAQSAGGASGNAIRGIADDLGERSTYMDAARRLWGWL
ncbi:polymorphic toxin-type HINT domain-containing protein, partial [Microtetraspora sp. NBRC 13810]|uniref:polymorphic toxin-type HINT domain-containing protein n=1 Tax=Microtetraspora sp. NBRC 13810 TaxID=3030990 RepID=UPI002555A6D9